MLRTARPLEQQRRAAGLDRAVDDLRHLEVRIDLGRDPHELTLAFEERDPVAEVAGGRPRRASACLARGACAARRGGGRPIRELAEGDHAREDQPDDQHAEMTCVPSLAASKITAATLASAARARARPRSSLGAPPSARAASTHASPSPAAPSARSAAQREISSAIAATAGDAARLRDPHEPVRVEVVAEQHRLVGVGRREEPGPAVVDEVRLVDRLEPGAKRLGTSGEKTGSQLGRVAAAARPDALSPARPGDDRRQRPRTSATAATVASISASPCASDGNRHSYWLGASRRRARAARGRARRTVRCPAARTAATGSSRPGKSVSIAPTRCTCPNGSSPASSRAERALELVVDPGRAAGAGRTSPAAVASGLPLQRSGLVDGARRRKLAITSARPPNAASGRPPPTIFPRTSGRAGRRSAPARRRARPGSR